MRTKTDVFKKLTETYLGYVTLCGLSFGAKLGLMLKGDRERDLKFLRI